MYYISYFKSIKSAIKLFLKGERIIDAFHITLKMRSICNRAFQAGFTPEEIAFLLDNTNSKATKNLE